MVILWNPEYLEFIFKVKVTRLGLTLIDLYRNFLLFVFIINIFNNYAYIGCGYITYIVTYVLNMES